MADIALFGEVYRDVPAVELPKSGGGKVRFTDVSDTTATSSSVLAGKYFYTASGERTVGSNSGQSVPNLLMGTFVGTDGGTAMDITLPYDGTGHPIAVIVAPSKGLKASSYYNANRIYNVGYFSAYKTYMESTPTYSGTSTGNQYTTTSIYKSSSSSPTTTTRTSGIDTSVASGQNASAAPLACVTFKSRKKMSVYFADTSFGLMTGLEYSYIVVYSVQ